MALTKDPNGRFPVQVVPTMADSGVQRHDVPSPLGESSSSLSDREIIALNEQGPLPRAASRVLTGQVELKQL